MADTIRTEPTEKKITHHVSFSDGTTELGLVLCNGYGHPDTKGFRQGKMPNRSLQISQGDPDYSDMELPYTPITQKDWSGGRGQADFEIDKSRYADGQAVDGSKGEIVLGPKATAVELDTPTNIVNDQEDSERIPNPFTAENWGSIIPSPWTEQSTLIRLTTYNDFDGTKDEFISGQTRATRFQWTSALNLSKVKLWLANTNSINVVIMKYHAVDLSAANAKRDILYAINAGVIYPGSTTVSDVTSNSYSIVNNTTLTKYELDFPKTMAEDEYYIIAVRSNTYLYQPQSSGFEMPFLVGTNNTPSTLEIFHLHGYFDSSVDGGATWLSPPYYSLRFLTSFKENSGDSLAFELVPQPTAPGGAHFFTLRGTKFLVTSPADGGAPKLYMEGYHGYAADNSADKTKIHAINIGAEADGCIVKIVGGPGYTEHTRWREIQSVVTGASGYLVVDPAWNITHTTSTEYVVLGTSTWTEITGHGITKAVTDVMVVDDIVYFCMDAEQKIRRMTCYNNSGAWAFKYAEEDYYATYMKLIQAEDGTRKIWRANANTAKVSSSSVAAWQDSTAKILSFGSDITCGNTSFRINGLVAYGTPRIPYVLKEDGFGAIANSIYDQVPLAEFAAVADDNNGRANLQRGVYLYLSMLNGLERYYEGRLDDIGPNRDEGLPNNRNGQISSLLAYPGRMYASIDHPTGYSSILLYNDIGWHEIYRSGLGARIYNMDVQVIDGDKCDRLWVAQEGSITWLPIAIDPRKQDDYTYSSTGSIETSWISGNFKEIKKFYSSVEVFSESLTAAEQYVRISYKLDTDDNDWVEIDEDVDESPSQKILFPNYAVYGKRIKLKLTLYTTDTSVTPRIKGITINPVTRLPIKKSWSFTFRVDDNFFDLQGKRSELTADELMAQIEEWADSDTTPLPLTMNVPHLLFNSKRVFIEPESFRPVQWLRDDSSAGKDIVGIGQLTVYEA